MSKGRTFLPKVTEEEAFRAMSFLESLEPQDEEEERCIAVCFASLQRTMRDVARMECTNSYWRERRAKDPEFAEHRRVYQREYRAKRREEMREYQREYRKNIKEREAQDA